MSISINTRTNIFDGGRSLYLSSPKEGAGTSTPKVEPIEKKASFKTYGEHNERVAIVVKNAETGEIFHEIPSEGIQRLHMRLRELLHRRIDEKV